VFQKKVDIMTTEINAVIYVENINSIGSEIHELSGFFPSKTVRELKTAIGEKIGKTTHVEDITVFFGGQELVDRKTKERTETRGSNR
jgi:hypothetical protein